MKMKKILSVMLTVSLTAGLALTGCGKSDSKTDSSETSNSEVNNSETNSSETVASDGEKIQISFLNGFTGGDGEFMRKITDGFNESQDKYEIIESQDKDHYVKFKSGDYDLVVIHGERLKTYIEDEMIQEVSSIYEAAGIEMSDFDQAGEEIVTVDGGVYAFPLDIHPLVMFYNKELVAEAPTTYEEILALNEELQAKDSNLYAMGIPGLGLIEYYYMALANQNDIDLQEGDYLNFAQEEFAEVFKKYNDMIFKDKVSPAKLGLDAEFKTFVQDEESGTSAQTAIALTGPWYYSAAKEKFGDNLGVAPVPVIGEHEGVYGSAHTIAMSTSVEDEAVKAGIAEFFKYMYQPEVLINWADAGQAPLHVETMNYIAEHKDEYPLAYANHQQFANFKLAPAVYNVGDQLKYINENLFQKVVTEEMTIEQIMEELEKATKIAQEVAEGL